jgi:hypothetical protein
MLDADMDDPAWLLKGAMEFLDMDRPVAVTFLGALGHIPDLDDARDLVRYLLDRTCSGSYLVINDGTGPALARTVREARRSYGDAGAAPYLPRSPEEIESFFEGMDWVPPGFVCLPQWRPDPGDDLTPVAGFGGVGRRR